MLLEVRRVVREVSLANERFPPTAIIEDGDIEFGVFTSENVFSTAGIDQASGVGADAIRVTRSVRVQSFTSCTIH